MLGVEDDLRLSLNVSFGSISVDGKIIHLWIRSWHQLPLHGGGNGEILGLRSVRQNDEVIED